MNKQKWLYLLSGLLVMAMFLAPGLAPKQQDRMKQAALTSKPQRIVSMSPGNTEIVFALGAGDRVVGVTSYSDYPEEAKTKPTIGGYHAPDVEKIVSLAPDVVFAMTDIQAKYIQILRQAGIRVVAVEPKTLPEILNAIDIISEALGEEARGRQLHQELAGQLDQVRRQVGTAPAKRTFLEVWDTPLLTVGRQSFIHDLITQAGGINVSADKNVDYTPCDIEQLYAYNPEVYVVLSHSREDIRSVITNPNLAAIQAVKTNQVFSITDDLLQRPGPRSFTGLVKLAEILHPQEMKEREKK